MVGTVERDLLGRSDYAVQASGVQFFGTGPSSFSPSDVRVVSLPQVAFFWPNFTLVKTVCWQLCSRVKYSFN